MCLSVRRTESHQVSYPAKVESEVGVLRVVCHALSIGASRALSTPQI